MIFGSYLHYIENCGKSNSGIDAVVRGMYLSRHPFVFCGIKWIETASHISTERCDTLLYNVLVTFRSATQMQKAQRLLRAMGIMSRSVRPSLSVTQGSCGYGLEFDDRFAGRVSDALRENGIEYGKLFFYD